MPRLRFDDTAHIRNSEYRDGVDVVGFRGRDIRQRSVDHGHIQLPARHLRARLEGAALVIEGEVERIEPSPIPDGEKLRSPYYQLAVTRVASKLKGECGEHVNVLFPTNPAPPWRTAPRLKEHESAVFILRHESELKAPPEFFTALDPTDVRPRDRDELNRIRALLR